MSPYQHGEVFVTDDGAETDLDLGHYERFIDENLAEDNNITSGRIYWSVIQGEREGLYLGKTVQVIPHITDEIKDRIYRLSRNGEMDLVITEIGGTVGDIESLPFLEAIRQMRHEQRGECAVHPCCPRALPANGGRVENQADPAQRQELRSIGIQPDIIVCRTEQNLPAELKENRPLLQCQ